MESGQQETPLAWDTWVGGWLWLPTGKEKTEVTGFAKYRQSRPAGSRSNLCPRCAKNATSGSVVIGLKERKQGKDSADRHLASSSRSMCEACCITVYEYLVGALSTNDAS